MIIPIILTIIIFMLVIFFLIMVGLTITWERAWKLSRLRKNLSYFPPEKLNDRLELYMKRSNLSDEDVFSSRIASIKESFDEISIRDYKHIEKSLDRMALYCNLRYLFSFIGFRNEYLQVFRAMESYENEYLNLRFSLFDLTADSEVEKAVLEQIKDISNSVFEKLQNSPRKEIRESSKLERKRTDIRRSLRTLEELVESQVTELETTFIEEEEKIMNSISVLANIIDSLNGYINHIEQDIYPLIRSISEIYKTNKTILTTIHPNVVQHKGKIEELLILYHEQVADLKITKLNDTVTLIDKEVEELNLLIHSNIDYSKFNYENADIPSKLFAYAAENNNLFISEISRHRLPDETPRKKAIQIEFNKLESTLKNYEISRLQEKVPLQPTQLNLNLMKVVYQYREYINVVERCVSDISMVNASTDLVNTQIAKMNTKLLQVEYNIVTLTGIHRSEFEKKKEELQNEVSRIRITFKDNTKEIDELSHKYIDKIDAKINDLVSESKSASYEVFFLKETILYLNRFKGRDISLDTYIEEVSESFNEQKYKDTLRKTKELIDIYGIK